MIVRTAAGASVELGAEIARGGEAVIRRVVGDGRLLAKVFFTDRTSMADKLRAMRDHPPPDPAGVQGHSAIAWPRELLLDDGKRLIGFLMPYVQGAVPALDVLNPRRRAQTLPDFDRAYLHRAARNLASALAALHAAKVVVGDLNERNVLVTPRALVTLIDADSFQIQRVRASEIVFYPCPVGRAEYTPPELQGQPFHDIVRLPEHDAFGLAVLLFQLLMAGSHPFRSAWLAEGEAPPLEEKIRRGWFPYVERPAAPVAPPPGAPALGVLRPALVDAFGRAFVHGHAEAHRRPTAEEWSRRLEEAEAHLIRCPSGHAFADHLAACPDCGARRRGAPWVVRRKSPPSRVTGPANTPPLLRTVPATRSALGGPASQPFGQPPATRRALAGLRAIGRSVVSALAPPPMPSTGAPPTALRRVRLGARRVAATTAQAVTAACSAALIALIVSGVATIGAVPFAAGAEGALGQSVTGWLAGGLAMAAVVFARSAIERRTAPATPAASTLRLGRTVADPMIGWTVGWIVAASLFVAPGWVGRAGSSVVTAAATSGGANGVSAVGWAVGWATFGAVAGALVAAGDTPVPARTAALFAAIGYGVARGVAWLLAAMP